jgi:hypothetical protein
MGYQVVSRFFDYARGVYVDPGAPCPDLDAETVARLVRAKCLVEVPDAAAPSASPRAPRKKAADAAQPDAGA